MTEPRPDELQGGAEREPLGWSRGVKVAVAVAAVVVVGFLSTRLDGGAEQADPSPSPSPPAPPRPRSWHSLTTPSTCSRCPSPGRSASSRSARAPITASGSPSSSTCPTGAWTGVTVLDVTASLPIGGPTLTGVKLAAKPCSPGVAGGTDLLMRPRGTVSAALRFRLPPECPAPYPVQAVVSYLGAGEQPRTQRLHLLNDLGELDFEKLLAVSRSGGARRSRRPRSGSTRRASAGCSTRARWPSWC